MPVAASYADQTFGRITLTEPVQGKPGYWKGRCACGNPVEKRSDNLKRPGLHSCGRCLVRPRKRALEQRVQDLEEALGRLLNQVSPVTPSPSPPERGSFPHFSVVGKAREPARETQPRISQFFGVVDDFDFWQARALDGKVLFWADTEEEAAYAVQVYLEATHNYFNKRVITDAELTLSEERREQIRYEVIAAL